MHCLRGALPRAALVHTAAQASVKRPHNTTIMVYCFDGQYLSAAEEELVDVAIQDLDGFVARGNIHRAMIFPAIDSRRRYLLHKTVELYYPQLCTFSVGEDNNRRLIIAFVKRLEDNASPAKPRPKLPKSRSSWGYRAPPPEKKARIEQSTEQPPKKTTRTSDFGIQTQLSIDTQTPVVTEQVQASPRLNYEKQAERMALALVDELSNDGIPSHNEAPAQSSRSEPSSTSASNVADMAQYTKSETPGDVPESSILLSPTTTTSSADTAPVKQTVSSTKHAITGLDASVYANSDRSSNIRHKAPAPVESQPTLERREQPLPSVDLDQSQDSSIIDQLPTSIEEFDEAELMHNARRQSNRFNDSDMSAATRPSDRFDSPPLDDDDREVAEINEHYEKEQRNLNVLTSAKIKKAFWAGDTPASYILAESSNCLASTSEETSARSVASDHIWQDWEREVSSARDATDDDHNWARLLEEHQLQPALLEDITSALGKVHLELERPSFDYTQMLFRPLPADGTWSPDNVSDYQRPSRPTPNVGAIQRTIESHLGKRIKAVQSIPTTQSRGLQSFDCLAERQSC